MRKVILGALVLFLISGMLCICPAQEEVGSPPEQESKLITAIEIKGNKAISTNTIISKMKIRVGSPYQENVISDDLKRLYLLGFFSDIKIDTETYKAGVKVIITVVERPIIEKITFAGMRHLTMREEKLKESLKSKEGQYLDYPSLEEDVRTLKKMYEKRGYSHARLTYKVGLNQEKQKASVEFSAIEEKRVRIKGILIAGNKSFLKRRLLKLMKTKSAWLFNAGALKEEVLEEDIERIKSFYRREGFADVAVDYKVGALDNKPYLLYIHITVDEGKKYLVGDVKIIGNKEMREKELLAVLNAATTGKVFSQDALQQDIVNMQGLYFDRGYIMVNIGETTSLNSSTGRTDITYNITENEVAYVDKIKVRGNVKTKDIVVRRELRIRPGDKFDGQKLKRSKERLQNLGFFEEVSYDTENTPIENKKDLIVEVKETKTGTFSFGGGYSTVDQFVGFIEVEQKNFDWKNFPYFTGAGQNLTLRAAFGTVSDSYNLSFTEPWMFDYPVAFGFDGYKRTRQRESDIGYGYDQDVSGGDLRLGKEFSEYVTGNVSYRFDSIKISNISESASSDLKSERGRNNISSITFGAAFDSRDNIYDTRIGDYLTVSIEDAGGPFGADKDYVKFFTRASHYFPLFKNSALECRLRIGLTEPYGDTNKIPIYERFFAGGAYTIRGYDERKVGPIDPASKDPLGGASTWIGNLEYTYPVFSFLKAALFYDAGNVWSKLNKIGTKGVKKGIGFGIRLKTPVGPIMLDYGIPMDKEPGEDKKSSGKFHFSMSQGF